MSGHVTIVSRFCGPPRSGNGGYSAGLAAAGIEGAVEVTLRRPPPLDRALRLDRGAATVLWDGDDVVLEERPTELELTVPPAPSFEAASAMSRRFGGFAGHPFPTCFVCGPARASGDGLRIFPGAAPGEPLVGAVGSRSLARRCRRPRAREFLWAALDCPGYFAIVGAGETALLGRVAAQVDPTLTPGEPCVVVGWPISRSGRKLYAGTALYDGSGTVRGRSLQTWITVHPSVAYGEMATQVAAQ
jgi:hypothetical protein